MLWYCECYLEELTAHFVKVWGCIGEVKCNVMMSTQTVTKKKTKGISGYNSIARYANSFFPTLKVEECFLLKSTSVES